MKQIITFLLIIILIYSCSPKTTTEMENESEGKQAYPVTVITIQKTGITDYLNTVGITQPDKRITLKTFNGGLIENLLYDYNDYVKEGDTVAKIDLNLFTVQLKKFLAEFEIVQRNYMNDKRLFETKAIPEITYKTSKNRFEAMQQDLEQTKIYVDRAILKAPWNGFITQRHVEEQELTAPMTPIYTIAKLDKLKVIFELPERFIRYFKDNETNVYITFDAYPDVEIETVINKISKDLNYNNMTYEAEANIDNPDYIYRSGLLSRIKVLKNRVENTIVVPSDAVLDFEDGSKVFIVENGAAVLKNVKTGIAENDKIQILSGLNIGEEVIIDGQHIIFHGDKVEVVKRK